MVWNEKRELMEKKEKKDLQLKRLKKVVKNVYENVPFYREKMKKAGVKPEDIKTLKDIEKLPFTTKNDLREAYPFDLFAVPDEKIVEIHATSGTTGKPTITGYTEKDIKIWAEITARALVMGGGNSSDKIQNCYGYGLFTGGFGIHYGAHKLEATVVPMSTGNTKRQLQNMRDFETSILTCTPSYAMYLAEALEKEGYGPEDINLKTGIFGAEMWTEGLREKIEEKLGIDALNIYGLTEVMGPGVAQECLAKDGLHISDDHFYPEIINPKTGETLDYGEKGELVFTTLTKEGAPVIRFRTRDITRLRDEECPCGRTLIKMDRITGRTDDMMKIKGVMVFPSQIEKALLDIEGLTSNYQIIVTRPNTLDEVEVKVEPSKELFFDEMKNLEALEAKIANSIQSEIGIKVSVTLSEPESLPRSEGKSKRVIDKRKFV